MQEFLENETDVMNNLNIGHTFDCVKNIVDNIRCSVCDKADGCQMRYSCGHTACVHCVNEKEVCEICIPIPLITSPPPKFDDALTQRVKNASDLLKACQDLFHTDVFNQKRLSEQLRIEKELFPRCIQAPAKYENKRRSTSFSNKKSKNQRLTYFPGEETSPFKENIMETSVTCVQQWLHKNDKDLMRKPFRDLNVNSQLHSNIRDNNGKNSIDNNAILPKPDRKWCHFKTTVKSLSPSGGNRNTLNKCNSNSKRFKKGLHQTYKVWSEIQNKCDKDESGIFMENEDLIVIDDSQEIVIDKDTNAWLAVLEANKNETTDSTSVVYLNCSAVESLDCNKQTPSKPDLLQNKEVHDTKVPFYKRSYITETCTYCNKIASRESGEYKEVNITIDNSSFTTSIKISNYIKDNIQFNNTKTSISTQTDINETNEMSHIIGKDNKLIDSKVEERYSRCTQSEDVFADKSKINVNKYKINNVHTGLVIEESDSDMDLDESGPLPVQVDVHRSCDETEYGILGEIVNIQEHDTKPRRGPRGLTPTSTDSSEKENFNPNRMKKKNSEKKKYVKK